VIELQTPGASSSKVMLEATASSPSSSAASTPTVRAASPVVPVDGPTGVGKLLFSASFKGVPESLNVSPGSFPESLNTSELIQLPFHPKPLWHSHRQSDVIMRLANIYDLDTDLPIAKMLETLKLKDPELHSDVMKQELTMDLLKMEQS
jgi:hypothetical protein